MYVKVAAGFSLRFLSSDEFMTISRKLRNLKVAATCPTSSFVRAKIAQFISVKLVIFTRLFTFTIQSLFCW